MNWIRRFWKGGYLMFSYVKYRFNIYDAAHLICCSISRNHGERICVFTDLVLWHTNLKITNPQPFYSLHILCNVSFAVTHNNIYHYSVWIWALGASSLIISSLCVFSCTAFHKLIHSWFRSLTIMKSERQTWFNIRLRKNLACIPCCYF